MTSSKTIGRKILEARKNIQLSQAQLAEKIAISPQAIGKWERGESMPDITMLDRLSKLFRVDLNYFSENHGKQSSEDILEPTSNQRVVGALDHPPSREYDSKWDMSEGNWVDADFSGLKRLKEKFAVSNLKSCKFIESDLSGLSLNRNYIKDCDFSHANFRDSRLVASQITQNNFTHSSLIDATYEKSIIKNCDFRKANLSGAEFISSDFQGNNLNDVIWKHAAFKGTHLTDVVFNGNLEDCSFENCGFKNVKFENATLINTFFKHNKKLSKVQFIACVVDKITYAFLKTGKADLSGICILQ